jgi:hypothetical protein
VGVTVRGDLRQSSFPDLLRHLYADRRSGTLHLSSNGLMRRVHFRKGAAVFAEDAEAGRTTTRQGAEALLASLFSWTSGEFSFQDGEPEIDEQLAFGRPTAELILEGSRTIGDPRLLERFLGSAGTRFACSETTELPLFQIKLSPAEGAILTHARTETSFQAADLAHLGGELSVLRSLNTLVSLGLLQIVEKDEAPEPESRVASPLSFDDVPSDVERVLDSFPTGRYRAVTTQAAPAPPPRPIEVERPAAPPPPGRPVAMEAPAPAPPPPPAMEWRAVALPETEEPKLPPPLAAVPRKPPLAFLAAASAVALIAAGLTVALWPESDVEEPSVAAATVPPAEIAPPDEPKASGESATVVPERSDADLFYEANLAFEQGHLEAAKSHLSELLSRRPDFAAAQDLLARVEREAAALAAPPPPPPAPKPALSPPRVVARERAPETVTAPSAPPKPDPASILREAETALARGELDEAEAKLDELRALDSAHPGAGKLREALAGKKWEKTLPLGYAARHSHRLGGCDGVVSLAARGIGFQSKEHEWFWSFSELAKADRKDEKRLSLETRAKKSFNFELEKPLPEADWKRFLALRSR